jgi:hypothetical protein
VFFSFFWFDFLYPFFFAFRKRTSVSLSQRHSLCLSFLVCYIHNPHLQPNSLHISLFPFPFFIKAEASRQKSPAHAVPVAVPSSSVLSISPSGELTIAGESMVATPLEKRTARICEVTFISPTYAEYLRELSPLPELVNAQPLQEQSLAELLMSPPIARPFYFSTPISISPFCQIQFGIPVPSRGNEVVPASPTQLTNHSEESDEELELDVLSPSWFKTPPRSALRELNFGESPVGIEDSIPANELQASEEEPAPSNVVRELALASKEGAEAPTSNIRSAFARVVKGLRRAVKGLLGFFRQRFVCMF